MATWTGTGAHNSNYTGTLTVTEQSYNVASNSSVLAYSLVLTGNSGYYFQQTYLTTQISINGSLVQDRYEQISMPSPSGGVSTYNVCSGTVTVPHNADGTKTVTVWATMSTPSTQSYLPGEIKMPSGLNGSLTLTTIPRESTMTIPTMTVGSSGTFTISAASTSFTHSITYTFGNLSGTAATAAAGVTSVSWTPPNTFYNEMPYSDSGYITLVLHTYSSGTEIGSTTYSNKIVYVPSSIKPTAPTVTLTPVNSNAWLNSKGLYVGGYSKVKIDSSASPGTGAYISSYTITNSVTGSGASYTSGILDAGSKTISVTVADTRGRTNFTTVYVHFQEYSNPSFSTFNATRGTYNNGTWTADAYGNHIRVEAVGSVSLSASGNVGTKTIKIGNTTPNYTSGNYYYFTGTNAVTAYTISGTITDSVGNSGTASKSVSANPAASTLSIPTLTIGSAATLTVTPVSNTLTHKITYSFSGLSGTIATLNAGVTTASWTPPNTFYAKLPNSTSGTVSIVLETYSGATKTGSNSYNATVNVGSSIKPTTPTVTLSPVNSNAWINSKGIYVSGYTRVRVQSSATAGSGASMSSYTISGAFAGTGADVTSAVLSGSGNKSITVTATDSRGRTNTKTSTVTYLAYSNPSLTTFTAVRGTYSGGVWTSSNTGDHIRVQAVGTVSLSANGNTGTVTVKIGNTNPSATSGNYYYFTSTNGTTAYTVTGSITDSVGNTSSRSLTVPTIEVPLNINVDLPGVGFGMIAQKTHVVEIAPAWVLEADGKYTQMAHLPYSAEIQPEAVNGYAKLATLTITGSWINGPITFKVWRRNDFVPVELYLFFAGASGTDPAVDSFMYSQPTMGIGRSGIAPLPVSAYAYKTAAGVWDVYIQKSEANEYITVAVEMSKGLQYGINVTYPTVTQTNIPTSIPSGAIVATLASPKNITFTKWHNLTLYRNDTTYLYLHLPGLKFAAPSSNDILYSANMNFAGIAAISGTTLTSTQTLTVQEVYQRDDNLEILCSLISGLTGTGVCTLSGTLRVN